MRRILIGAIGVAGVAAMLLIGNRTTDAADHLEAANAVNGQDISDLYAWMDVEAGKVNLVADIVGGEFSTATQYVFHVHSGEAYLDTPTETQIICQFAAANNVECWVGDPEAGGFYLQGDPSDPDAPLTSPGGEVAIFAGPRNDPFFFNIQGFQAVIGAVEGAAGGLVLDANGCPNVDPATAATLGTLLGENGLGEAGVDDFAAQTVASLIVQVNKNLVNAGGPILGVWTSTHVRQ